MNICIDWEQLEQKHTIAIDDDKATVKLGRKQLFTARAIVGTKAVEVRLRCGPTDVEMDVEHIEKFTEANLAFELKIICLFLLADLDLAVIEGGSPSRDALF